MLNKYLIFRKIRHVSAMFTLVILFCVSSAAQGVQDRIDVVVSIPPQKYFVEQIGGEYVNVSVMLPPGASPHSFEPRPSQMVELGSAHLYMAIGVEYEKALLPGIKSMHEGLRIIHTDRSISKISMSPGSHFQAHHQSHEHSPENHGHEQENHRHEGLDPHVWLSPDTVRVMAGNIYQALAEVRPEHKDYFQDNYINFHQELLQLDQDIKGILSQVEPGTKFMVFHPAWGYFARSYELVQVPIEVRGKEPGPADLKQLIDTALRENIKVVFVSPQFSERSAKVIAQSIEGQTVFIDPLAREWKDNMLIAAEKFRQAATH
jgi:zinc transport system substrate-binding protein